MNIIIDNKIPFIKGILEPFAEIRYLSPQLINNTNIKNADALIIRSVTKCNNELLHNTKIKFIATATIGFDHIDTNYCKENGIAWINAPGCNSTAVQQYTINAILYLGKQYKLDITKLTLGIVGIGNIGSKVVKSAKALGINILLNDPPRERNENSDEFVNIETIRKESNIISFHVPLTYEGIDKTYHMVDEYFIDGLKMKPFIINTARGEIAKSDELFTAIRDKKIQKAILDVWDNEPYITQNLAEQVLLGTPHIAGYSIEGKARGSLMAITEIIDFFGFEIDKVEAEKKIMPRKQNIMLNCEDQPEDEILEQLLSDTYSIKKDHELFMYNLHNFEKLRSEYNYRHDYTGYNILPANCSETIVEKLKMIGFGVLV